jgi:cation:H+ antiporter
MMLDVLFLVVGLALLTGGGEALIRGSLSAARRFGVSPFLTGLVIVGFGTSAPEMVVSVGAAVSQSPEIAVGNVVGSNIANILLILGMCALIRPLAVKPMALRRDAVTVVAASALFLFLVGGNGLGRVDATILLSLLAAYLVWAYWGEHSHKSPAGEVYSAEAAEVTTVPRSVAWTVTTIGGGLLMLIFGSQVLLKGAVGIAVSAGISEAAVGLTLVAVGTSLPEMTISVLATIRGHADVAVGNVLGSNIFNLLGILGASAMLRPLSVNERFLQFDQWVLLGAGLLMLAFLYTGRRLNRLEGGILLAAYSGYVALSFTVFGG